MSIRKGSVITGVLSLLGAATVVGGDASLKKTKETAAGSFERATFAGAASGAWKRRATGCRGWSR